MQKSFWIQSIQTFPLVVSDYFLPRLNYVFLIGPSRLLLCEEVMWQACKWVLHEIKNTHKMGSLCFREVLSVY